MKLQLVLLKMFSLILLGLCGTIIGYEGTIAVWSAFHPPITGNEVGVYDVGHNPLHQRDAQGHPRTTESVEGCKKSGRIPLVDEDGIFIECFPR